MIAAGLVSTGGVMASRPADQVDSDTDIAVARTGPEYVGRGGVKLAAALDRFRIDPQGRRCLDVGASTGGFTDCLLQRGATAVVAVDVGTDQLAAELRDDDRVVVMEQTDVRSLDGAAVDAPFDLVVVDVSFVSVCAIASRLAALTSGELIVLCKPQFEVGRSRIGKRGVVVDPVAREDAVNSVTLCLQRAGFGILDVMPSPISGGSGNIELLVHARPARGTEGE